MSISEEDTELINSYHSAPLKLIEALANLSESDMDATRAPGKWSIREIAHHIIECDLNYFQINRYLCKSLPNALERELIHQNGRATVRDALRHDNQHAYHHIEQILETRRIHLREAFS